MHILLISTSYPESGSGSEAAGGFVADFARELARHARVTVVAAAAGSSSVRDEDGVEVYRFAVARWPLSLLKPLWPGDWWPILKTLSDGLQTVRAAVGAERPDYILALWALPSGYWARSVARQEGIPYGVWALGSDIWSLGRVPVLKSYLKRVLLGANDRYADGLRLAEDVLGICGKECDFMPSARTLSVDAPGLPADAPPYRLAFLGRWHANKGIDLFLRSLLQLADDDWDRIAEVRVRGGGAMEDEVRELVGQLQALGRPVDLGGYLDVDEATDLIEWSDYLALPSRIESIPVVFSDAAQLSRPLVATPVGDLPLLFEKEAFGVLAEGATVEAYTAALQEALGRNPRDFQQGLSALAAEFDIEKVAARLASRVAHTGMN